MRQADEKRLLQEQLRLQRDYEALAVENKRLEQALVESQACGVVESILDIKEAKEENKRLKGGKSNETWEEAGASYAARRRGIDFDEVLEILQRSPDARKIASLIIQASKGPSDDRKDGDLN
jgi:hypothetical protein